MGEHHTQALVRPLRGQRMVFVECCACGFEASATTKPNAEAAMADHGWLMATRARVAPLTVPMGDLVCAAQQRAQARDGIRDGLKGGA